MKERRFEDAKSHWRTQIGLTQNLFDIFLQFGEKHKNINDNGYFETIQYLWKKQQDVTQEYLDVTLNLAASHGSLNLVKSLVSNGADIHKMDDNPLECAALGGHLPVVDFLITTAKKTLNPYSQDDAVLDLCYAPITPDIKNYLESYRKENITIHPIGNKRSFRIYEVTPSN